MRAAAVIPAYNAEKSIGEVIERTLQFVERVVVIDDGSKDRTSDQIRLYDVEGIFLENNKGKANAIRLGLKRSASFDAVVALDADLQHRPEEIPALLSEIEKGADLCVGSRFLSDHSSMPFSNRFSNSVASRLVSFFAGQRLTDPQSGFRALRGTLIPDLELKAERYSIEHIMILEAARKKFMIKEVPITCLYGDEESSIRTIRDTVRVTKDILGFVLR